VKPTKTKICQARHKKPKKHHMFILIGYQQSANTTDPTTNVVNILIELPK